MCDGVRDTDCITCSMASAQQAHSGKLTKAEKARVRKYGISLGDLRLINGNDLCQICQDRESICVDHNHSTGAPRGALCRTCNGALHFIENEEWLKAARAYLDRYGWA